MNSLHKNMIIISKKNFRVFKDLEGERPDEYIDPHFIHEDILVNINSLANLMQNAGIIANY